MTAGDFEFEAAPFFITIFRPRNNAIIFKSFLLDFGAKYPPTIFRNFGFEGYGSWYDRNVGDIWFFIVLHMDLT